MDYEIEVFLVEESDEGPARWGFRVGNIVQTWVPDVEGFILMTQEEAQAHAEVILSRLTQG